MDRIKEKLIAWFGSQKNIAKALGKTDAAISAWGKIDGKIPEIHRYKIEILTRGEFTFAQLSNCDWRKK